MKTLTRWVLAAIAIALSVPLFFAGFDATARHVRVSDDNTTNGLLDIRLTRNSGDQAASIWIVTYKRWTLDTMWDKGYLLAWFETRADARYDYYVLARSDGRRMRGTLYRDDRSSKDKPIADVTVWRSGKRTVRMRVPLKLMDFSAARLTYHWYAQTLFTGRLCRAVCLDRAPNSGGVEEPIPGAPTPTPTISVSPVVSVTPPT